MVNMATMTMPELHVGRGTQVGPLTVFPVWASAPAVEELAMGAAAEVAVAERDGSPMVGELILTNTGTQAALLIEGELLEGGWQHRALQHDVILRRSSSMVASVACVEAGRWNGGATHVRRGRRASGNVRAAMSSPDPQHRQQDVWSRVSRYGQVMGTSPTSSHVDHLDRIPDTADVKAVQVLEGQRGVIVGLAGQPVLLEVFPTHEALRSALPDLLSGLLVDAMASGAPNEVTPGRRARRMVERLDGRRIRHASGVDAGDGESRALETAHAVLRGVTMADQWAHLSAFNRHHPLVKVS